MRAVQPALWLLIFGEVFNAIRGLAPGGFSYIQYIAPGVLAQSVLFVSIFYGITIVWERDVGLLTKLLSTPSPRIAVVVGKALAAGVRGVFQGVMIFGLALIIQGLFRNRFGSSGLPYRIPAALEGGHNLGFMFLPNYRAWVVVFSAAMCLATWYVIDRTKLGSYLRAATENPALVQAFGVDVPRMVTLTYGFGVGLAALAGVLAAPIYHVNPLMGGDLIIVVFAVVVIGGMGSIMGSIVTGFTLGVVEGLTKVFYPEASNTVIFVLMAIVLLVKPTGLFGRAQ